MKLIAVFAKSLLDLSYIEVAQDEKMIRINSINDIRGRIFKKAIVISNWLDSIPTLPNGRMADTESKIAFDALKIRQPELFVDEYFYLSLTTSP